MGATVHLLSKGIDTGDILFHCLPQYILDNPFLFTMRSVEVAHVALAKRIQSGDIHRIDPVKQDLAKNLDIHATATLMTAKRVNFLMR